MPEKLISKKRVLHKEFYAQEFESLHTQVGGVFEVGLPRKQLFMSETKNYLN